MGFDFILKKLNEYVSSQKETSKGFEEDGLFIPKQNKIKKFDSSKFKLIPSQKEKLNLNEENEAYKKIIFIDGGNQSLISTQNFAVYFNRVGFVEFIKNEDLNNNAIFNDENNKQMKSNTKIIEFYSIIKIIPNKKTNEIEYEVEISSEAEKEFFLEETSSKIIIKQEELKQETPDVNKVANIVRRLQELNLVKKLNETAKKTFIVLDGSVEPKTENEKKIFNSITSYKDNEINENVIIGVSKTNSLITSKGKLVGNSLNQIAKKETAWFYDDFPEKKETYLCFSKLNPKSKHVFMIDFIKTNNLDKNKIKNALYGLAEHSKDSVFLGYPYGLIKIDDLVRITNNEAEYLKIKLEVKIENKKNFEFLKSNSNTHSKLDSLKF